MIFMILVVIPLFRTIIGIARRRNLLIYARKVISRFHACNCQYVSWQ